jgi:hypothetical protein
MINRIKKVKEKTNQDLGKRDSSRTRVIKKLVRGPTVKTLRLRSLSLDFKEEPDWVFKQFLYSHQELNGFFTIYDSMVIGEG